MHTTSVPNWYDDVKTIHEDLSKVELAEEPEAPASEEDVGACLKRVGAARGTETDVRLSAWQTAPSHVFFCPSQLVLLHRTTGELLIVPRFCGSWMCEECAPQRAVDTLRALWPHFRASGAIFYHNLSLAGTESSEKLAARIRQRAARAGADYVWIRRIDESVHIYATHALTGREQPTRAEQLDPVAGIVRARLSLAVPGVQKVGHSDGWRLRGDSEPDTERRSGVWQPLGTVSVKTWELARQIIADRSEQVYGEPLWPGTEPPPNITPEEVKQLVLGAIEEARSRRRAQEFNTSEPI